MISIPYGSLLLDCAWLVLFTMLWVHFYRKRKVLVQAQTWLKAKGRITHYESVQAGHNIWPKIEYHYQVHEHDLVGHYLFLDTIHNNPNSAYSRRIAYKAALAFKDYSEIEVYYNPNNPEQSALDVTIPLKLNIILGLISIVLLIHLGIIIQRIPF